MSIRIALLFYCVFTLWSSIGMAAPGELGDNGGSNDNPHNFSTSSSNGIKADTLGTQEETQICIFCHTPHSATPQTQLWSRLRPNTNPADFDTYNSATLVIDDNTNYSHYGVNDITYEYPNGASKMCLSCHDGVTAIGSVLNHNISVTGGVDSTIYSVGSNLYFDTGRDLDLTTSHPVSFTYDSNIIAAIDLTPKAGTYTLPTANLGLLDGFSRVQCTTCHQPHMDTRKLGTYPFWRILGGASGDYLNVCNACHTGGSVSNTTGHPL